MSCRLSRRLVSDVVNGCDASTEPSMGDSAGVAAPLAAEPLAADSGGCSVMAEGDSAS